MEALRQKALEALEEAVKDSGGAPIQRTQALRFTLAFLSNFTEDRGMFDWFWKSLADPHDVGRSQNLQASLNGIYRAVGVSRPGKG